MTVPSEEQIAEAQRIARRAAEGVLRGVDREGIGADDVVQDVMMRFIKLDLTAVDNWRAWVTSAAKNRSRDIKRAEGRHRGPNDDDVDETAARVGSWVMGPSAAAMNKEMVRLVLAVLDPQEQQMLLRQSEGASNDEIAAEFGYANGRSAAVAISRAKKKVRDRFHDRAEILQPQRPYGPPR